MTASPLTVADLARAPAWPRERVRAIPGRCRGALLRDWGNHVRRLWGDDALAALRAELGLDEATLPDAPALRAWYPVRYQCEATRLIADRFTGGDPLGLAPLLADAGSRLQDGVIAWAIRTLGPGVVLKNAGRVHKDLYDVGRCTSRVGKGEAELRFSGAELFAEPTWRVLQMFALEATIGALGRTLVGIEAEDPGGDGFVARVAWR